MTKQLHHSLKGDLSSEHQVSESKASFVKGVQSRLELRGFCMFPIHISITGGGNRGLLSLVYLFPAKSFPASGLARSPAHPSDKAPSPEEQLQRVHAPCLVSAPRWGGWSKQVPVGAPLHACSPLFSPSALAEQFKKISFLSKCSLFLQ